MPISDWWATEDWENVYLGGVRIPGTVSVTVRIKGGLNVKKPRGHKLARVQDEGVHPAEINFEVILLPEDVAEFEASIIPMIRPAAEDGERQALQIWHPNARAWGVFAVVVDDVDSPPPDPGGPWVVRFTALEWTDEPKKVKKKPAKAENGDPGDWDANKLAKNLIDSSKLRAVTGF